MASDEQQSREPAAGVSGESQVLTSNEQFVTVPVVVPVALLGQFYAAVTEWFDRSTTPSAPPGVDGLRIRVG